jgi:hypothetical protein
VRVEALDWFMEAYPPLTLNLTTWCSPQGTWVVAIAYQLQPTFGRAKGGIFYLNPRQTTDAEILSKFLRQDGLPVIFLSEDCAEHYTVKIVQDPQELNRWRELIDAMSQALTRDVPPNDVDQDFELAVRELENQR